MTLRHFLAAAALLTCTFMAPAQGFRTPVRNAGDDGAAAYRIPGLVTTPKGTLVAVYDIRYAGSWDLQADIDVGMSRSTDGGRTWEPMKIIIDMGEWGGLSQEENGVGDPCVLVDPNSGKLFVLGTWTHGIKGQRAWTAVGDGFEPGETAQLMLVTSEDDGLTWSEPRNLTRMIKQPEWNFTFQGPGRGIVMADGTLVFPMQYINAEHVPSSTVMVSHDGGESWIMGRGAKLNTTESQVIEVEPGVLMLNMRDNRGTGRAVATSSDYGQTWTEHPTSGRLVEPVCMASILRVPKEENDLAQDIILFSNPADPTYRAHMTVKASLDGGWTWLEENQLEYDPDGCWGYSCLTMIDRGTVGILYESATAHMQFVAIPLKDIVREDHPAARAPKPLPALPKPVSAPFMGLSGSGIILAGGADFPDVPAAEGGAKRMYSDIYRLGEKGWERIGQLPVGTAYGATFESEPGLLYFAGGHTDDGRTSDRMWRLAPDGTVAEIGALPKPLEQMGFAADGDTWFLAGGLSDGVPSRDVYARMGHLWRRIAVLPEPLVQPVLFATPKALYVWGGYDPGTGRLRPAGYKFDRETRLWQKTAPIPDGGTFVGAAAARHENGLVVVGGVNREVFEKAIQHTPEGYLTWSPGVYGFRDEVWHFDPATETWRRLFQDGRMALAGAGVCCNGGSLYVAGGEVKPGVRTAAVQRYVLPAADLL